MRHILPGATRSLLLGALIALTAGALVGGCDDGPRATETPNIFISPSSFIFPKLAVGEPATRTVEVSNDGTGDLLIAGINLDGIDAGRGELTLAYHRDGGDAQPGIDANFDDHFSYPVRLAPDERMTFTLTYVPADDDVRPTGAVVLATNLPGDEATQRIPIVISDVGAEINVNPGSLDFGRVPAGGDEPREIRVSNLGQSPLIIANMVISGSQDFTPLINGRDPRRDETVLDDPDGDGEPGLSPVDPDHPEIGSFIVVIHYAPTVEGPDRGELSILSNDATRPEVKVDLVANTVTSCLAVSPSALEFRTSLVNRTDSRPLSIESCGSEPLTITAIYLRDDSDPAFALDQDSLPERPLTIEGLAEGELIRPSRTIRVAFTPRDPRIYNGTLIIESDDPVMPVREVSLLGRGVLNDCPQARAAVDEFNVHPLDVVVLDGTPSIDQDGPNNRPVEYEWVITSRPNGSISQPVASFYDNLQPANSGPAQELLTPTALFFIDLAGTYTAELRVRDNLGLDSVQCNNPAVVTIIARPDEAIHIQLVWTTPNDPDQTDRQGADLDLHLLHPNADSWFSQPFDCHYNEPVPDWGQLQNPADDPSLDIDDINGGGPENINLNLPENTDLLGAPYIVGVHYYSSHDRVTQFDYGASFATVRIFINGEMAWDYTDEDEDGNARPGQKEMRVEDHFWDVAQISWPSEVVTTRDNYYTERP